MGKLIDKKDSKVIIAVLITILLFSIYLTWEQRRINNYERFELGVAVSHFKSWRGSVSDYEKDKYRLVVLSDLSKASGLLMVSSYNGKNEYLHLGIDGLVQCMMLSQYTDMVFKKSEEIIECLQAISKNPSDIEPARKLAEIIASIQGVPMYIPK